MIGTAVAVGRAAAAVLVKAVVVQSVTAYSHRWRWRCDATSKLPVAKTGAKAGSDTIQHSTTPNGREGKTTEAQGAAVQEGLPLVLSPFTFETQGGKHCPLGSLA